MKLFRNINNLIFNPVNIIPLSVIGTKLIFSNNAIETSLVYKFIGWFSILYISIVAIVLFKSWYRLDELVREFDREADAINYFLHALDYIPEKNTKYKKEIVKLVYEYVLHVKENFGDEIFFIEDVETENSPKVDGDLLLEKINTKCKDFISKNVREKTVNFLGMDLLKKLNEITDIRGDRITLTNQELFKNIKLLLLSVSIIFLIPFYLIDTTLNNTSPINILIFGVTFLVIFIYLVIDDIDDPFSGTIQVNDDAWEIVVKYIETQERI